MIRETHSTLLAVIALFSVPVWAQTSLLRPTEVVGAEAATPSIESALEPLLEAAAGTPVPDKVSLDDKERFDASQLQASAVQAFDETASGQEEQDRLKQRFPWSDFHTTGFYAPPNSNVVLNVEQITAGSGTPQLLIGTYSRHEWNFVPVQVNLVSGINSVASGERGGILYIRYNASEGAAPAGRIRVQFMDGHRAMPYYVRGITTNEQWRAMLDDLADAPDVQLVSNKAIIVASRAKALEYRDEDQSFLLELVDYILDSEDSLSGMDNSAPEHLRNAHRILMTQTDDTSYWMAAYYHRTFYHPDAVGHILSVEGLGSDGWGPWHELGHMHQQNWWTWSALSEVTVNLYSLAVERDLGITPSRLVRDGRWDEVRAYLALSDAQRDFNSDAVNVWVRLAMFYQLHLAFEDGDFYPLLHKGLRENPPPFEMSDEMKMTWFMLASCLVSGRDLRDFYTKWGLPVELIGDHAYCSDRPLPDFDLTTLTDE